MYHCKTKDEELHHVFTKFHKKIKYKADRPQQMFWNLCSWPQKLFPLALSHRKNCPYTKSCSMVYMKWTLTWALTHSIVSTSKRSKKLHAVWTFNKDIFLLVWQIKPQRLLKTRERSNVVCRDIIFQLQTRVKWVCHVLLSFSKDWKKMFLKRLQYWVFTHKTKWSDKS